MKFFTPLLFVLLVATSTQSQYFEFPTPGWTQGYEYSDAYPPFNFALYYLTQKCIGDTIINSQTYRLLRHNFGLDEFIRQDGGKIFRYANGLEELLYDFSSSIGDTLEVYALPGADNRLRVIDKGKFLSNQGDSLIWIELENTSWSSTGSQIWMEGIGSERWGFLGKYLGFETGFRPQRTYDLNGEIRAINLPNPVLPYDLLYGEDRDQDWVFNYYPQYREVVIDGSTYNHFNIRACDTLRIYNNSIFPIYVSGSQTIDLIVPIISPFEEAILTDLDGGLRIHHQYDFTNFFFGRVWVNECFEDDCDDQNPEVHRYAMEIPYNNIDDDCNPLTLDDDLDGDGFVLAEDCNDEDAEINPDATEVPYNGIDEDCNAATLDDDLDQDGFVLAEDCNDENAEINPDATEVPYNGIDEDCDAATLDDDLDQDGFVLAEDCDDENAEINPDAMEVPYNGIDEDCNAATLDDDLDQDGFVLAEDCDDENAGINPEAMEIPDNGIDEDCDGSDLVTGIRDLSEVALQIYPNPVAEVIYLDWEVTEEWTVLLYDVQGRLIYEGAQPRFIDVNDLGNGVYILEVHSEKLGRWNRLKVVVQH